jgi:hypothetical protein
VVTKVRPVSSCVAVTCGLQVRNFLCRFLRVQAIGNLRFLPLF